MMDKLKRDWLQFLTHILSVLPLVKLVFDYSQHNLTANPIAEITLRTGLYSLVLLVLSLACTPVANLIAQNATLKIQIQRLRRPLGLYGFIYAALHFLNFIAVDYRFNFDLLQKDVLGKVHIWIGLAALLLMIPAAVTSTKGWARRLGKNWERLHRLVYPAALLSALHFLLIVKADYREPALYVIIVILLLLVRLRWVRGLVGWLERRYGKGNQSI